MRTKTLTGLMIVDNWTNTSLRPVKMHLLFRTHSANLIVMLLVSPSQSNKSVCTVEFSAKRDHCPTLSRFVDKWIKLHKIRSTNNKLKMLIKTNHSTTRLNVYNRQYVSILPKMLFRSNYPFAQREWKYNKVNTIL